MTTLDLTPLQRLVAALLLGLALVGAAAPVAAAESAAKVNVNTAAASELALLPRVGPALAGRIIEHREANGPFEAPADLVLVRGIGEKTFALMEPYVAIEGDTTLEEKVSGRSTSAASADGERR